MLQVATLSTSIITGGVARVIAAPCGNGTAKAGTEIPADIGGNQEMFCAGQVTGTAPVNDHSYKCDDASTPGLKELLNKAGCGTKNPIFALLEAIINWMTGILGGLAVLTIIIGGIQYITSSGKPDAIKKAKSRITNAVVGIIVLTLMFFILKLIGI